MTDITGSTTATPRAGQSAVIRRRIVQPLRRAFARYAQWRRVRRDEALLMKQPDYMLRDIGLGRSEIEAAIRGEMRWRRWRP